MYGGLVHISYMIANTKQKKRILRMGSPTSSSFLHLEFIYQTLSFIGTKGINEGDPYRKSKPFKKHTDHYFLSLQNFFLPLDFSDVNNHNQNIEKQQFIFIHNGYNSDWIKFFWCSKQDLIMRGLDLNYSPIIKKTQLSMED